MAPRVRPCSLCKPGLHAHARHGRAKSPGIDLPRLHDTYIRGVVRCVRFFGLFCWGETLRLALDPAIRAADFARRIKPRLPWRGLRSSLGDQKGGVALLFGEVELLRTRQKLHSAAGPILGKPDCSHGPLPHPVRESVFGGCSLRAPGSDAQGPKLSLGPPSFLDERLGESLSWFLGPVPLDKPLQTPRGVCQRSERILAPWVRPWTSADTTATSVVHRSAL